MKPMTNQEFFDTGLNGVRAQGYRPSVDEDAMCQYRGPFGLKCHVGHCIPDDVYDPDFEGWDVTGLQDYLTPEQAVIFTEVNMGLALKCQRAHDHLATPETWAEYETDMAFIAIGYGLVYTPPPVKE